jgi:excisionase family DNA binding protein
MEETEEIGIPVEEAARLLGVSDFTVRRLLQNGRLRGYKITDHWRTTREAINEFIQKQSNIKDKGDEDAVV